jgi:alkylhydroperoxidase family enzyme
VTLTAQPWALTGQDVQEVRDQGLDEEQVETAVGVVSMFNYFTRAADATGIEFDYLTPLPAFEPDLRQITSPRPTPSPDPDEGSRPRPAQPRLQAAWESWRNYVLETDEPLTRRERRVLASVAAEETADWQCVEELGGLGSLKGSENELAGFARKLSREPWRMVAGDLEKLRASGYSDTAVLHIISVVSHQNSDSRLAAGLRTARRTPG